MNELKHQTTGGVYCFKIPGHQSLHINWWLNNSGIYNPNRRLHWMQYWRWCVQVTSVLNNSLIENTWRQNPKSRLVTLDVILQIRCSLGHNVEKHIKLLGCWKGKTVALEDVRQRNYLGSDIAAKGRMSQCILTQLRLNKEGRFFESIHHSLDMKLALQSKILMYNKY